MMDLPFLQTEANFILQLTNSITVKPRGWAEVIGKTFPHARVHRHRRSYLGQDLAIGIDRATPGTISISEAKQRPGVITIFGQFLPGNIGSDEYEAYSKALNCIETSVERNTWFVSGLEQIGHHFKQKFKGRRFTIAFPPTDNPVHHQILGIFQTRYQDCVEVWFY